ncbi:hypothetical protein THAOC_05634, partial [Thalassiosira oceanica]
TLWLPSLSLLAHAEIRQALLPDLSCHSIWGVIAPHPESGHRLYVPVFVVEKRHLTEIHPGLPIQRFEMLRLIAVADLDQVPVEAFLERFSIGGNEPLHALVGPAGLIRPRRYSDPQVVIVLHSIYFRKAVRRAVEHADWRTSLVGNNLVFEDGLGSAGRSPGSPPAFAFRFAHEVI